MIPPQEDQPGRQELPDEELPPPIPLHLIPGGVRVEKRPPLPHNQEIEESVVGGILFSGGLFARVMEVIESADLFHPALRAIFEAMGDLHSQSRPIDIITVAEHMQAADTIHKLKFYNGEAYLAELANKDWNPIIKNIVHHAEMVRDLACRRRLIEESQGLAARGYRLDVPASDLVPDGLDRLEKINRRLPRRRVKLFDKEAFRKKALAALAKPIAPKLSFGLDALDEALNGGFPSGGVAILAAPPKHLKTGLLISFLIHWASGGQRIVYVSGENTCKELLARMSAHEQFGKTNKFHGRIKDEWERAEENFKPIEWLAGHVEIISLPDEELEDGGGRRFNDIIRECEAEKDPPILVIDYVEEMADRMPGRQGETEQTANKAIMRVLKNYACRNQARALAVCSVGRGAYSGEESVFQQEGARAEAFGAVAKHSGYIDYAASLLLALQYSEEKSYTDPEGFEARPMKLHLPFAREGTGAITIPILTYAGFCRVKEDKREEKEHIVADTSGLTDKLQAAIMKEMIKQENCEGQSIEMISRLVAKRVAEVRKAVKDLVADKHLFGAVRGRGMIFRHPRFGPLEPDQGVLLHFPKRGPDEGGGGPIN